MLLHATKKKNKEGNLQLFTKYLETNSRLAATCEATRIYQPITNNHGLFYLW